MTTIQILQPCPSIHCLGLERMNFIKICDIATDIKNNQILFTDLCKNCKQNRMLQNFVIADNPQICLVIENPTGEQIYKAISADRYVYETLISRTSIFEHEEFQTILQLGAELYADYLDKNAVLRLDNRNLIYCILQHDPTLTTVCFELMHSIYMMVKPKNDDELIDWYRKINKYYDKIWNILLFKDMPINYKFRIFAKISSYDLRTKFLELNPDLAEYFEES